MLYDSAKTVQPKYQWYEGSAKKAAVTTEVLLMMTMQTQPFFFCLDMLECVLSELANLQAVGDTLGF